MLDGLNQVRGSDPNLHLRFLPRHFPPHVTVLASALPGPALDALRERGWAEHDLPRASEAEVDVMIGEYFRIHGRYVDAEGRPIQTPLRRQLAAADACRNPLFLRTVLEELRQFGSFEQLPARVTEYLKAATPKELFLAVLRRWQEDFDGKKPQAPNFALTRRALTHLWAAREGLSEPEWLDLLGMDSQSNIQNSESKIDAPLPRAYWTPLFLALEPYLSQRAGLFAFGHDFLRQAVEAAFVEEDAAQRAAHLAVADYFERRGSQREMTTRKAAEWPFQLHAAEAWERLEACLTDIPLFLALYNDSPQWELTGFWHPLRRNGRDMGSCYAASYERWTAVQANAMDNYLPAQLGRFLSDNGLYAVAEPLLRRALEVSERVLGTEDPNTLCGLNNLALLLSRKGDFSGALPLYERSLAANEQVCGADHPDTLCVVNNIAGLLAAKGNYNGAQPLHERALEASERVLGQEHPDTLGSVSNLAVNLAQKGDYAGAQPLFERALEASARVLGAAHPDTICRVNHLATLLSKKGDYAGALPLCERALAASERVLGAEHPSTLTSMNNLANVLTSKGDYAGALSLFERALKTKERVFGAEHPGTLVSVSNLALLLAQKGDYAGAQPLFERALEASERVLGAEHPATICRVNHLATLLAQKGDYAGAQPLFERALEASARVPGAENPGTLTSVNNLAKLLADKGNYKGSQSLYERVLETNERVLGAEHPDTLTSINNLANVLRSNGDYAGAQSLFERALEASERVRGAEHSDTLGIVNNLAGLLLCMGDYAAAQLLFERALEGLLKLSQTIHRPHPNLEACVENYAGCFEKLGRSPEQIRNTLTELGRRYGVDLAGESERAVKTAQRQTAGQLIREGRYTEAGEILEQLLAAGFEIPGTSTHLARVCLLTDHIAAAREHAEQGWAQRANALPYVISRLLWLQLAGGMLEDAGGSTRQSATVTGRQYSEILGRMKNSLQAPNAQMEWTMQPVLEHIRPKLPEESMNLLTALIAALNDSANLPALDAIPAWRDAEPLPIN